MADPTAQSGISHRTFYLTALLLFLLGFFAGVVLTAYKTRGMSVPSRGMPAPSMGDAATDGGLDAMVESLRERAAAEPDNPEIWAQLGHLYFDADRFPEAVDAYERALERDPENADLWTDLGVMHRRTGNPARALEAFDRAVALDPRHEISRFNRGIVLMHDLDRAADALRTWEELAEINPVFTTTDGRTLDELIRHYREHAEESDNANENGAVSP